MQLYKQVLIILAEPLILLRLLSRISKKIKPYLRFYETRLFKFTHDKAERREFFYPFFELLPFADKGDFTFNDNPLLFVLRSFEPEFYKAINA